MKYDVPAPDREQMIEGPIFSHGPNILGRHVDAIMLIGQEGYPIFQRKATLQEIADYCKGE